MVRCILFWEGEGLWSTSQFQFKCVTSKIGKRNPGDGSLRSSYMVKSSRRAAVVLPGYACLTLEYTATTHVESIVALGWTWEP